MRRADRPHDDELYFGKPLCGLKNKFEIDPVEDGTDISGDWPTEPERLAYLMLGSRLFEEGDINTIGYDYHGFGTVYRANIVPKILCRNKDEIAFVHQLLMICSEGQKSRVRCMHSNGI